VIKRDFIERQIEEFARALARFLQLREQKRTEEARQEAAHAARELTGHELTELVTMPAELFSALGPKRQRELVRLLRELAALERSAGRAAEAAQYDLAADRHVLACAQA
jgi:hypothetical protein